MIRTLKHLSIAFRLIIVLAIAACWSGGGGEGSKSVSGTTSVSVYVSLPGLPGSTQLGSFTTVAFEHGFATYSDVAAMTVEVRSSASTITMAEITKDPDTGAWSGVISDLPMGPLLTFIVSATDGGSPPKEIFSGSDTRVLAGNDTITIRLSQVPGDPLLIPRILSVSLPDAIIEGTSANVYFELQGSPNEELAVTITPAANGGTFQPLTAAPRMSTSGIGTLTVRYAAPEDLAAVFTHMIRVVNSQGNSVESDFIANVVMQTTNAGISTLFNPVLQSISAKRAESTVTWTAVVVDDRPLNEIAYDWGFSQTSGVQAVVFEPDNGNPSVMLNYEETVGGTVGLSVTDMNGAGGTTTVEFTLPTGQFPDDLEHAPETLTVDAFDRGWWNDLGVHASENQDTFTGNCCIPNNYRSYFQFDLSGVSGQVTVVGAALELEAVACVNCDEEESLSVWDVTTDAESLDQESSSSIAVYEDLGSGFNYGQFKMSEAAVGGILSIPLNAQAVSEINALLGSTIALGVSVDTLRSTFTLDEGVSFGGNEPRTHRLVLIVRSTD